MTSSIRPSAPALSPAAERVAALDWSRVAAALDADGYALITSVLTPAECRSLAAAYEDDGGYRSVVVMARHGFGRDEYKYFAHPLPEVVASLRSALYPVVENVGDAGIFPVRHVLAAASNLCLITR